MSVGLQLGLIVISVSGLLVIMGLVRWLAGRHGWSSELQRKCVHVATGIYALTLPFTFTEFWPVLLLCILAMGVLLFLRRPRSAKAGLGSTLHSVARKSYGELLLPPSIAFIFYFSRGEPILFVLPMAVLTLSDAAAALVGTHYGKHLFTVEEGIKSLEGAAIFFLVTWITSMSLLLVMTDVVRVNVFLLSLMVAAFGTMVEAASWRGMDNLFVPVGIHLFLKGRLEVSPMELLWLTAIFFALLLGLLALAKRLGLSWHAARAYAVLIFLICAVTALHNAILPIAAVLAHIAARRIRPCESVYPDLDLLAVVAGVSLFWLFIGEYAQHNALAVYNLTFAGATLVFAALAARSNVAVLASIAILLFAAVLVIGNYNPPITRDHGALWPWVVASFALCLGVAALRPTLLDRQRAQRSLALALPVPLVLFLSTTTTP